MTASSMSWVMNSTVVRVVRQMPASSSCMSDRVCASSAANGSSMSSIFGSFASARAIWIRCFIPPDSSAGYFCCLAREPDELEVAQGALAPLRPARRRACAARTRRSRRR